MIVRMKVFDDRTKTYLHVAEFNLSSRKDKFFKSPFRHLFFAMMEDLEETEPGDTIVSIEKVR